MSPLLLMYLASLCVKASNERVDHVRCAGPVQYHKSNCNIQTATICATMHQWWWETWGSLQGFSLWSSLQQTGSVHTLSKCCKKHFIFYLFLLQKCLTHSSSCREQCSWQCTQQTGWCRRTLQIPPLPIWSCMCLILLWIILIVPKRQKLRNLSERLKNLFWSLFITMIDLITKLLSCRIIPSGCMQYLALVWSAATMTKSSNCIPIRHSILFSERPIM